MDVVFLSAVTNYWYYYVPPIIGRDEEVRQLYDLISSSCLPNYDTHVVTVLGPPNVRKDAVVAKVCSQLVLSSSINRSTPLFELYGWVNVSRRYFNVQRFSRSLLSVLRPKPKSPYHSTDPVQECSRLLSKRRCLVVINGLQRTQDCSELANAGLIYKHPNSCIVVVTNDEGVATFWRPAATAAPVCKIKSIEFSGGQQVCLLLHLFPSYSEVVTLDYII